MKNERYFPDLSAHRYVAGLSEEKTEVKLDGMHVIFDKKVAAVPVSLDYKKKKK